MNHYACEFLARERLDQFAREARAWDSRSSEPGTAPSLAGRILGLLRRLTNQPRLDSPSGSSAIGPHIA
jgi:hypothetical protein